jgi:hypothetical protein
MTTSISAPDGNMYAVIDASEEVVALARNWEDAVAFAQNLGTVYTDAPAPSEFARLRVAANGPVVSLGSASIRRAPEEALRAVYAAMKTKGSGPIVTMTDVEAMSSQEAFRRLRPMFPSFKATKAGKITPVKAYSSPESMAEKLIGQNYKTAKGTPQEIIELIREDSKEMYGQAFEKANVKGLSILPHTTSYTDPNVADIRDQMMAQVYGVERVVPVRLQSCSKASPECAKSCLVFSGRNLADDYNTVKKYSLLQSLITEPVAFCRMLVDAIQLHRDRCIKSKTMPLIRLNVFSDLPWELMFPDLFDHFDGDNFVQFYDYTKVPGRVVPSNYDLTFSFAGVESSGEDMVFEINRQRRRIAVVFARIGSRAVLVEGSSKKQRVEIPLKPPPGSAGIPDRIWDLPVIDGDVSDMRPFDPSPSVVALRWKTPANQGVTLVDADAFIVKGVMVGGQFVLAETPRFTLDYSGEPETATG